MEQNSGNMEQNSGNMEQNSGNMEQNSGNMEQNSGNKERIPGNQSGNKNRFQAPLWDQESNNIILLTIEPFTKLG
jgi:hypothetical protein